jgi:hypothetical protein
MNTKTLLKPAAALLTLATLVLGPSAQVAAADQTTPAEPPATPQMPMMGGAQAPGGAGGMMPGMMRGGPGSMGMKNPQMMQQHWDAMQTHMTTMETRMANIESLLRELVALQKVK